MVVSQSDQTVSITFGSATLSKYGVAPSVTLDTWHLIGFAAHLTRDPKNTDVTIFVGTSWYQRVQRSTPMDILSASVVRIGGATNSISGQISIVRITTPGGGFIKTSNPSFKYLNKKL